MRKHFGQGDMELKIEAGERIVSDHNTIIHCHHYNSRIQKTIEGADLIDGKEIFRASAAKTFGHQVRAAIREKELSTEAEKLQLASELYSYLGFGAIHFDRLKDGSVSQNCSHFVEGWKSGQKSSEQMVCSFTEGYIEGALAAVMGKGYRVRETQCMALGAEFCQFSVEEVDTCVDLDYRKRDAHEIDLKKNDSILKELNSTVDMDGITRAVFGMPLFGNDQGIIPAFSVYLAHMPRDFYNLACYEFIKKMDEQGMRDIACDLLKEDAENCGLNTFAGIMNSEEWSALIKPMIKNTEDNLYGLVAVANALGWGKTGIVDHVPYESLELSTLNGYESVGAMQIFGPSGHEDCAMLSGVSAGMMALVYGSGDFNSRAGVFNTVETECYSTGAERCTFKTTVASESKKGRVA